MSIERYIYTWIECTIAYSHVICKKQMNKGTLSSIGI